MYRYSLHVPEQHNDGAPISDMAFSWIEIELANIAGGFTRLPSAIGAWNGQETVYREPVSVYIVDSAEDIETELRTLAAEIAHTLSQEAVYLTRQEIETWLVTPAREEIAAA